jgi:Xaa-Pro aminopeptidase
LQGFALVTLQKAALWTDGRYFLQANQQLDSAHWTLMKAGLSETPTKEAWLAAELKRGDCVGVDPALISFEAAKKLKEQLEKSGQSLVAVGENLIDAVWAAAGQPAQPTNAIEHLPVEFSGRSSAAKIEEIRGQLQKSENSALIVTALDEIACT